MTVKVDPRYLGEIQEHIKDLMLKFGVRHTSGQRNEELVIALMVLKGVTSLLLASMAKAINLDKDVLLEQFVNEVKDQFQIFDEFERTQKRFN